jgi:amino acid transporter
MRLFDNLLLTPSSTSPASSVFIIVPGIFATSGSGALLSMLLGACVGICMAFVYAELSSAFPLTGGEYAIIGRAVDPFFGFVVMGVTFVSLVLVPTVMSLGISSYLGALKPTLPVVPTAMATIILATAISILHVRANAVLTGIFLLIEMLALMVVSALGFLHPSRSLTDLILHPLVLDGAKGALGPAPVATIGMAAAIAVFAYNGYGTAVYFGEETRDAPRHVARAILWALGITVVTELVPVTAVLLGAPDLKALLGSSHMFGDFILARAGSLMNNVISLGIALAIFNAVIVMQLQAGRYVFSTGRDAVWPAPLNRAFVRTHRTFHSPWVATLFCGAMSTIACLLNQNILFVVTGTGIIVIYALLCVAAMLGRWKGTTAHGHYHMPLFPLAPIIGLIMLIYIAYTNWVDETIGRPSLLATLGIVAASSLYYLLVIRRRGQWILHGPDE